MLSARFTFTLFLDVNAYISKLQLNPALRETIMLHETKLKQHMSNEHTVVCIFWLIYFCGKISKFFPSQWRQFWRLVDQGVDRSFYETFVLWRPLDRPFLKFYIDFWVYFCFFIFSISQVSRSTMTISRYRTICTLNFQAESLLNAHFPVMILAKSHPERFKISILHELIAMVDSLRQRLSGGVPHLRNKPS